MTSDLAFRKGIPSVFVVCSPFQVLCAVEALREFEINDYLFFVHINANEKNRIEQTFKVLNLFHIEYKAIDFTKDWSKFRLFNAIIPRFNKYKRAFIGHFRVDYLFHTAFSHISNNSVVIYLDDGMNCLTLLDNTFRFKDTINHKIINVASNLRSIIYNNHLFTIYSDYNKKNNRINIYPNSFKNISWDKNGKKDNSIYIIGTVVRDYCIATGITESKYLQCLERIFKTLRASNDKVYYFPHGRDRNSEIKRICDDYQIQYIRPSSTIELYMFDSEYKPKQVYGFSSSALFNISLFFPNIEIYNYMYENNQDKDYEEIARYFMKHGIKQIYYK